MAIMLIKLSKSELLVLYYAWNNSRPMDSAERQTSDPEQLATQFLYSYKKTGTYEGDLINRLAQLAASDNLDQAKAATTAIFASLVEKLADAFEPKYVLLYNRLFAQLIHLCRTTPQGEMLDHELTRLGISTEAALITRAEQLRHVRRFNRSAVAKEQVIRIIILSRVTIGADVAITIVIMRRLKQEFPNAQITLVGNLKAAELFGGDTRISFAGIDYKRGGTLTERLLSWLDVLNRVREISEGLTLDEWLIVDPDSRLTQLGLMPLLPIEKLYQDKDAKAQISDKYLFFPSREIGSQAEYSLSELTALWLNAVFGDEEQTHPQLSLHPADCQAVKDLIGKIKQGESRPLITINYGVGDNAMKRVSDEFESELVARLLQNGATIILDKGAGAEELERAERVIGIAAERAGQTRKITILEANEANLQSLSMREELTADILVWSGRIGLLAAMIAESDLYIGYDSAGQHIASALAVPCIDIFAGYSSPRMLKRWRPTGRTASYVIAVDSLNDEIDEKAILAQTLERAQPFLASR